MAEYGIRIRDESGKIIFDNNTRIFKILGRIDVPEMALGRAPIRHFQIPLIGGQKGFAYVVGNGAFSNDLDYCKCNQDTGLIEYLIHNSVVIFYGSW